MHNKVKFQKWLYLLDNSNAWICILFLSHLSSENHILEDVNKCVIALQEGMWTLDRTAGAIRGRAARVVHIINAEMENYEPGVYTERVLESIKLLSETGENKDHSSTWVLILCHAH